MLIRILIIPACIALFLSVSAQNDIEDYYWIEFSDKAGTLYSTDRPEEFLSERAIQRRKAQNIQINQSDLPVSQTYLDSISNRTIQIIHTSKWLNGVTVKTTQNQLSQLISDFDFITDWQLTKPGIELKSVKDKFALERFKNEIDTARYGLSVYQVSQLNGQFLHNNGYLGEGMHIAVLDAGFLKVDELSSFFSLNSENRIIETRDIVDPQSTIYAEDDHGMNVLSIMAGEIPGRFWGTAPKANYYLIRSEDARSEYIIEEDNWVVAAEYADSIGVDIINSSLGYTEFDDPAMNHTYSELDGNTTRVTRAANLAFEKGMLVFSSAGNEGNDPWQFLVAPSDGSSVIGVGAVDKDGVWASFSSLGPNANHEVKPNVSALGWGTFVQSETGIIAQGSGTSFSCPVLTGMAACLWQAFPRATNLQIKEAIEKSASQYNTPDPRLGYGIPDFEKASQILEDQGLGNVESEKYWITSANPFINEIEFFQQKNRTDGNTHIFLFSLNGRKLVEKTFPPGSPLVFRNLSNLPSGVYVVFIRSADQSESHKLVKISSK